MTVMLIVIFNIIPINSACWSI